MEEYTTTRATRFLPQMVVATIVVAVLPVVLAWWLRAGAVISSGWLCAAVALAVSLALSAGGSFWWTRRQQTADILFSELMIWGWLRRYRVERQLVGATSLLGLLPGTDPAAAPEDAASREQLLRQLSTALEAQDPYLDGHSRRVSRYSATVADRMGLSDAEVKKIRAAAVVHDVGKLRVPPELLRKNTPLTDPEFEVVMHHAVDGAEMVAPLGDDELTEIVRHHHERFDGLGYPDGLQGEEIPLGARIVAVADTFDAITSARPYRPAARHKQAIDALIANAGTQLDPDVVRAFLRCYAGRRASVMWIILAVSPQRAFAWMRRVGHGGHPGEPVPAVPVGELAAGTVGRALVLAAAVGTTVGVGVARYQSRELRTGPAVQVAAATPLTLQPKSSTARSASAPKPAGATRATVHPASDVASASPVAKAGRAATRAATSTSTGRSAPGTGSQTPAAGSHTGSHGPASQPTTHHPSSPSSRTSSPAAPAPVASSVPTAPTASSTPAASTPTPTPTAPTTVDGPSTAPSSSPASTPPAGNGGGTTQGGGGSTGPGPGGPGGPGGGRGDGHWGPGADDPPGDPAAPGSPRGRDGLDALLHRLLH